ncbi:unnamed protein product [Timema podura]|uniref:Telomeric repeat-binding factor 2-interacting protein 1 n=1 Tax=Timema podura TaxID=61482 RepID=A0ABN7NLY5_TIMPD|nr:unnamed protein product [Timema podura]
MGSPTSSPIISLVRECELSERELFSASRIYSRQEDVSILEYITQHQAYAHIGGVMLWRQMEENMGSTRTWQSLKEHFLKKVLPNIESYHLSCERVRAFRESSVNHFPLPFNNTISFYERRELEDSGLLHVSAMVVQRGANPRLVSSLTPLKLLHIPEEAISLLHGASLPNYFANQMDSNGKLYTLKEDKELIKRVLAKVRRFPIGGVLIWKRISSQGSFKNGKRSWQSLKTRFIKYIQPNLKNYTLKEEERNILEQRSFRSESSVTATTKKNQQVSVSTNSATTNTDAAHPVDIKRPQLVTKRKLHNINKNVSASPYVALDVHHSPIVSRALFRDTDQPDRGMNNHAHSNSNEDMSVGSARCVVTTTGVDQNYELHKGPILKQSIGTQTFISGNLCPGCFRVPDDHQTQNSVVDVPNKDIDLVSVLRGTEFTVPVFKSIIGNRNANVLLNTRSVSEPTSNKHSEISHSTVEDRTNNVQEDVITFERQDKLNTNYLGNDSFPSSFHCGMNRTLETFSNPLFETILDMNPLNVDNCWEQITFKHTSKKFVASIKEKSCGKKNRIVTRQFVEPSRDSETCENIRPSRVKCNTFRNRLVKNCEELLKSRTELELQCSGGRVSQKYLPSSSPNIAEFDLTQDETLRRCLNLEEESDFSYLSLSPTTNLPSHDLVRMRR